MNNDPEWMAHVPDEYRQRVRTAIKRNALESRTGSQAERPQEILTPRWILDWLIQEWNGIALDPCADSGQHVPASYRLVWPHSDGLAASWEDRTFVNPPFKDLKAWLAKALEQAGSLERRITVLCPVRSHRAWWRSAMERADRVIFLPPVKFAGYDNSLPEPMCLMCLNWTPTTEPKQ